MWNRLAGASLAFCLLAASAPAAEKPFRVSLIGDGFDGTSWHSGVLIELDPGWKTYWRMPGDSGVPPEFSWTTSAPAKVDVSFPVPARHNDKSGESVGYEREVIFPVTVTPEKLGEMTLGLDVFFALCKDVCVPGEAKASITLGPEEQDPLGSARVDIARAAVPTPGNAITGAEIVTADGKPVLQLSLKEKPEDIFVETTGSAYFRAPAFSADGLQARLPIDNAPDADKLKGLALTITYVTGGKGHEQTLTLP